MNTHVLNTRVAFGPLVLLVIACVGSVPSSVQAQANPTFHGKTIGQWSAAWWNWGVQYPVEASPVAAEGDVDCTLGQSGDVWFLAGTFVDKAGTRRACDVPAGKALFFPLLNGVVFDMPGQSSEAELRAYLEPSLDPVKELHCDVDGTPCEYQSLVVRTQSPAFTLTLPPGSVYTQHGVPDGAYSAVADGYWVMLDPLPPGEHVIHLGGRARPNGGFWVDVTYSLTVVP